MQPSGAAAGGVHSLSPHKYGFIAVGRKFFWKNLFFLFQPADKKKNTHTNIPVDVGANYLSEDYYAEKRLSISRNNL